jgi:hypothetical protein
MTDTADSRPALDASAPADLRERRGSRRTLAIPGPDPGLHRVPVWPPRGGRSRPHRDRVAARKDSRGLAGSRDMIACESPRT